jgi:hypothetical protein
MEAVRTDVEMKIAVVPGATQATDDVKFFNDRDPVAGNGELSGDRETSYTRARDDKMRQTISPY